MSQNQTPAETTRDLEFTATDFSRVRALIYKRAGLSLNDSKQQMVYSRLSRRLRMLGIRSFKQYLNELEADPIGLEMTEFINALTTNLTSFFREEYHFPILAEYLRNAQKPIRIWCSAASTGEEPYSIAMTAVEALGGFGVPISIVATDIDTQVLACADLGIYPRDRVTKLSPERLHRFFLKGRGDSEGYVRIRQELRDLIEFKPLNLLDRHWPLQGPFDIIFCRNVMIYFDKATQASVLAKMIPLLKPEGLLFAGHSENFQYVCTDLTARGQTVYSLASANNGGADLRTRGTVA